MKPYYFRPIFLITIFSSITLFTFAQEGVNVSLSNNSLNVAGKITSLPEANYLYPDWHKGYVKFSDDKISRSLDLMYDLTNDRVIFKSPDNKAQTFKLFVKEFALINPAGDNSLLTKTYRNGFKEIDGNQSTSFYEILSDGKVKLLKKIQFKKVEEIEVGSIYRTKKLVPVDLYFVISNGEIKKVKKKQIVSVLDPKKLDLNLYLKTNKIDLTKDKDLSTFFNYYNAL